MKAESFSYICGSASTEVPWFPPDPLLMNSWRDEFFGKTDVSGYNLWMCGATLEGWATNDIDIIITGKIDSYDRLEKILHNAMDIGFKNRQLLDISWNDYYRKYIEKGPCQRRAICCEHFYEHDWCTPEECAKKVSDIETIVLGNEIVKNDEIITPSDPEAIKLGNSLWKVSFSSPSPKQISRILSGVTYKYRQFLIDKNIDFRDYIAWP